MSTKGGKLPLRPQCAHLAVQEAQSMRLFPCKLGLVTHACNPRHLGGGSMGIRGQSPPRLHGVLEESLGHTKLCLIQERGQLRWLS